MKKCGLEIFIKGKWLKLGEITLRGQERLGTQASTDFEYDIDYATDPEFMNKLDCRAASVLFPVSAELFGLPHWPPFALDIIPSGAARKYFMRKLGLGEGPHEDWKLLVEGGGNPVGNVRVIKERPAIDNNHPGFPRSEILKRATDFISYIEHLGGPVSGSTGIGGDAPKFVLREDTKGNFHADGALSDERTKAFWIVKFPRGKKETDYLILQSEALYQEIAKFIGLTTHEKYSWEKDTLFIPRFDIRKEKGQVKRFGMESLYSAAGVTVFSKQMTHEEFLLVLKRFSTSPDEDILEYVLRDLVNVALGNTDNHGRNQSLLKFTDGKIRLAPVYDFAPMALDDQGIVRSTTWKQAETGGRPDWKAVVEIVKSYTSKTREQITSSFFRIEKKLKLVPEFLEERKSPKAFTRFVKERIQITLEDLNHIKKAKN